MIGIKILVDQLHVDDLIFHQLRFGAVVIEFRLAEDVVVLTLMPRDFGKGQKPPPGYKGFILGGDDPIELVQGDNAVQIGGGIKILPQEPGSGVLQRDLPIEGVQFSSPVYLRHRDIIGFLSAHSASSTIPKSMRIFLSAWVG